MKVETMEEYVRWRGDLTFSERGFNEVDNIVLCLLSYLNYTPVIKLNSPKGVTVKEAFRRIRTKDCYELKTIYGGCEELLELICNSKRFGSMKIVNYADEFDENMIQFSAMEFTISPFINYIAFRGTDASIIGWKEDFMTSFTRIPAQKAAADYVSRVMKITKEYYIGGHSKGANLAVYAAAHLDEWKFKRVKRVFMNDGPGFCTEIYDASMLARVYPITTRIYPEYDIVGQVYYDSSIEDTTIVRSNAKGLDQHDLASWLLDEKGFVTTDKLDPSCIRVNEVIDQWVTSLDIEERKKFVEELFEALSTGGEVSLMDIRAKGLSGINEVLGAMSKSSSDAKKAAAALPKAAMEVFQNNVKNVIEKFTK